MSETTAESKKTIERYDPSSIEPKWQARWAADQLYQTSEPDGRPKYYVLDFYPYPSGEGLSVGHCRNYVPTDVQARYYRMKGYNVLHPMGWDAFGLPAENAAIKMKTNPAILIRQYAANYKRQMNLIGASYDWSREINSSTVEYYRWTQWMFLRLYQSWYDPRVEKACPISDLEAELATSGTAQLDLPASFPSYSAAEWQAASPQQRQAFLTRFRLAYRAESSVNWDPVDKTVIANEEVDAQGRAWRSGALVEKRLLKQWNFRITAYGDRLVRDLDTIDWPSGIVAMQRAWVGRSDGAEVTFTTEQGAALVVFTTRPDTLWGATFMVLAPEHPLVERLTGPEQHEAVEAYIARAEAETEEERSSETKVKTGVFIGSYAINPVNGVRIPIFIADYVLMGYGTGAIMAVPAHDQRDFEFARAFGLPVIPVITQNGGVPAGESMQAAYPGEGGIMVNSGPINGVPAGKEPGQSVKAAIAWLEAQSRGKGVVQYRLRDWLISRQRYWGTPIPIIHTEDGLEVPLSDDQLPLLLPDVESYEPTATGESPLATIDEWVDLTLPDGRKGRRETDTMGTFACSSWYYMRFSDPQNSEAPFDSEKVGYWLPVDMYVGGAEHAVMHLLYARFWTKVLYDLGYVPFFEPFQRLRNQGLILANDGRKMSKSYHNVITPDEVVADHGADALRGYECFISDFEQTVPWNTSGVPGVRRWLDRVWRIVLTPEEDSGQQAQDMTERQLQRLTHQTILRVEKDILEFGFNTAIAALMEFTNGLFRARDSRLTGTAAWSEAIEQLLLLLAPFAPHIAEELWERIGRPYSIHQQRWPVADVELAKADEIELVLQINGKVRDRLLVPAEADEEQLRAFALSSERVRSFLEGKEPRKVIVVPGRLVNIVV